jgi:succinoglycan biosynthesis protein ExoL
VEIADIQPAMLTNGLKGRLLRWIERISLQKCQLLLTASRGFLRDYFTEIQRYDGPSLLLENKVFPSAALIATRVENGGHRGGAWVIGYFGVFRCVRSLQAILEVA